MLSQQKNRSSYRLLIKTLLWACVGGISALLICVAGGIALGLVDGMLGLITGENAINEIFLLAIIGAFSGLFFGLSRMFLIGGIIGALAGAQSYLGGTEKVVKPSSLTVYILLGAFIFAAQSWYYANHLSPNRDDWSQVVNRFGYALVKNDISLASALTNPDLHERLKNWMARREAVSCPSQELFSEDQQSGVVGSFINDNAAKANYSYLCFAMPRAYSFEINNVILHKTEDGWYISDWEAICESKDGGETVICE